MEQLGSYVMAAMEASGFLAPLLFIAFHLFRPLLFLPVAFICITGGVIFGTVGGTIYSVIGVTLSSITFYQMIRWMPRTFQKLIRLKSKILGQHASLSTSQVALLRLVPFIHFHLLSLCIIEMSKSFKEYFRASFYSNIPLAFVYTSFGQWISKLSPPVIAGVFLIMLPMIYLIRKKEIVIKWEDFFQTNRA